MLIVYYLNTATFCFNHFRERQSCVSFTTNYSCKRAIVNLAENELRICQVIFFTARFQKKINLLLMFMLSDNYILFEKHKNCQIKCHDCLYAFFSIYLLQLLQYLNFQRSTFNDWCKGIFIWNTKQGIIGPILEPNFYEIKIKSQQEM